MVELKGVVLVRGIFHNTENYHMIFEISKSIKIFSLLLIFLDQIINDVFILLYVQEMNESIKMYFQAVLYSPNSLYKY